MSNVFVSASFKLLNKCEDGNDTKLNYTPNVLSVHFNFSRILNLSIESTS